MANNTPLQAPTGGIVPICLFAASITGLYASSIHSFLLFHSLVETISIVLVLTIFVLAWSSRQYLDNHYILFLGISFISVASFQLVHLLSYKGMGIFPGDNANLPTQLWIASRYLFSLSFLLAPVFITRRVNTTAALLVYSSITVFLFAVIFSGGFPDCFVEGVGLTPFKIVSEYLIIMILLAALGLLFSKRTFFDQRVLRLLALSIAISVAAEISFTRYLNVFDLANIGGHLFLLISVALIFRAIFATGIENPAKILFRNLAESETRLRRTADELQAANAALSESRLAALNLMQDAVDARHKIEMAAEEWERTFDSVPDLIAILDDQHRIVRVNRAMANQLNLEPSHCVGIPCYKAIHGTNVPPSICPHSRSLADHEEHESLVEETVFGGTFLVSTTPLFNRDGDMYASVHVARNVTRLSQIEKELRENEERLRLLGDNLPESAVYQYAHELDGSVRFLYVSAGIEQLNGISVEALLQDVGKLYQQIAPEYLPRFLDAEAKSVRELSDLDMEVPMRRPDGEIRWMRLHSRPRRFPDGRIVWDGVQTDITGRKQAESLLREKDARLQFHLDNSPMAVIEWDSDFTVLNWTGESERLFGWSAAETVGKPLTALQMVVEEDMPIVAATMARLTDGVTRQDVVTNRNYTKKGDIRHCTWYNSVLLNQEGKISSVLSNVIDITERIALENKLLKARNELEERVRERTQALEATVEILRAETRQRLEAVEALRRQELVLIQQNRHAAMGEMIGNIAHQWRQPLNTLGLFTQRLGVFYGSAEFNKEFLDTSVAKSMEIIQYMSHTIDDFRSFFSTDREKTEFSIDDAVTKALSLVEAGFRERKIMVERGGTAAVRIYGFPNEYAQVLLNIFINARDAINERNVQSPLVKINIATEGGSSRLTISDNAGGIPEDTIDKIFDPYFSTKGPQYGTGIGLFMSKTIIENNMGGRLTVCNTDVGAEFRIEV